MSERNHIALQSQMLRSSVECHSSAKMNKQVGLFQGPMCRVEDKCEVPVVPLVSVDT